MVLRQGTQIYLGQDCREFPISTMAIIDLMEKAELLNKGCVFHTDNWYSSPTLFHYLQAQNTSAVGMVCTNKKGMPLDLQASQGDLDFHDTPTTMLCLQTSSDDAFDCPPAKS